MRDECLWTLGQLYSFEQYDGLLQEYYIHLGGYSFPDFDGPVRGYGHAVREPAEDVLALAHFDSELAKRSLRWVARTQLANGDMPKWFKPGGNATSKAPEESDTEIWFVLAACEYAATTWDCACFDERVPFGKARPPPCGSISTALSNGSRAISVSAATVSF